MPRQLRRTVTDPDSRHEPARDDDMGVRLAGRLMRGQGGDLWVEARPGGGTSFGICLPAMASGDGGAGATDI
jgi:signal transduction histidine kinase